MAIEVDIALDGAEVEQLQAIEAAGWFTSVEFRNARSPVHPQSSWLDENNSAKQDFVGDWMTRVVPGRTVLDAFCANGGFSLLCAGLGAKAVHGVDLEPARVQAAQLVASFLERRRPQCAMSFEVGDIYRVPEGAAGPFDVVLALGGLYHVADPAFVLRRLRSLTREWLIVQTSNVLPVPGNWARFRVRRDQTAKGLSSIRGGLGAWHYSPACFRELLRHGGFEVAEERTTSWRRFRRFPWYGALCRPLGATGG
ncbi:MAG: class I SAM-dependent methyltransferase [Acidimicrobiales bacterium]